MRCIGGILLVGIFLGTFKLKSGLMIRVGIRYLVLGARYYLLDIEDAMLKETGTG